MEERKITSVTKNLFKGLKNCLKLYQGSISTNILDAAWEEVKDSKEKREMFFSLCFSRGDITNRHHKIFGDSEVDSGGNSNRPGFWIFFNWLWKTQPDQFKEFLMAGLFNEYQCFDTLFCSRVQTNRSTTIPKALAVYDVFEDINYRHMLADYVATIVNGNDEFDKLLVAKFLTLPRLGKRSGKFRKKLLPETERVMKNKAKFLNHLSRKLNWETDYFKGYRKWRRDLIANLESVRFSTKKVNDFTDEEFTKWIEHLPAKARERVEKRIQNTEKWGTRFLQLETEWKQKKIEAQKAQRKAEDDYQLGLISKEELEKIKKEAKINVGAVSFDKIFEDLENGTLDPIAMDDFVQNRVNLPLNSIVILDESASMSGLPYMLGSFLATICLYKNPDEEARNLMGLFSTESRWITSVDRSISTRNSLLVKEAVPITPEPLVDPMKGFTENFKRLYEYLKTLQVCSSTDISSIPDGLYLAYQRNSDILDFIKKYPVWIIISDSEWNNLETPQDSIKEFMTKCEEYFNFKPFIVAIDVTPSRYSCNKDYSKFDGIENLIFIPGNVAQIEQLITNFNDLETFDVYTPLMSIYRSNRYQIIRDHVL